MELLGHIKPLRRIHVPMHLRRMPLVRFSRNSTMLRGLLLQMLLGSTLNARRDQPINSFEGVQSISCQVPVCRRFPLIYPFQILALYQALYPFLHHVDVWLKPGRQLLYDFGNQLLVV